MPLPMNRPRTPNVAPEEVALFVAVRDPMRISGTSRICPTMVPTAIAEIVAHRPSPKYMPSQPKAMAPRPTEPPTNTTKNVPGVEVRSPSGMRSTPLRSNPDGPMPCGRGHFARRPLPLNAHGRVPLRQSSDDRGASSSPCAARRDPIGQTRNPSRLRGKPARHRSTDGQSAAA